jgi:hypothetical protein
MEITWDDDEGYEIRYGVLAKHYGFNEPYDKALARLQSDIRALMEKESIDRYEVEKAGKAKAAAVREQEDVQSRIEQSKKDIAVQQGYYAVENKPEHASRVHQLEASIAEAERRVEELRNRIELPLPSGGLADDEKKRLASAVKMFNHLYGPDPSGQVPVLPARYLGERYELSPDEYGQIGKAARRCQPEYSGVYTNAVVVRRQDYSSYDLKKVEPAPHSQTAMEIFEYYKRHEVKATFWDGSLYAAFGQTFLLRISASRLRDPIDWSRFNFAMITSGTSVAHPVFEGYRLRLPGNFMLFNDTIIVRHEFLPRLVVQSCLQAAPLPDDDDDY